MLHESKQMKSDQVKSELPMQCNAVIQRGHSASPCPCSRLYLSSVLVMCKRFLFYHRNNDTHTSKRMPLSSLRGIHLPAIKNARRRPLPVRKKP